MSSVIADPVELRRRGFEALAQVLAWVNAVRFLRQYEVGFGDYTRERRLPAGLGCGDAGIGERSAASNTAGSRMTRTAAPQAPPGGCLSSLTGMVS